ncbi:universal stress protein [Oxalobacteraceae bacterium OM1]|nr:universal stress protein [Oxalobacteraceae bacterium OM1]
MSYKTILVHVDATAACKDRLQIATALANDFEAHLIGAVATGVSRFIYQSSIGGAIPDTAQLDSYIDQLRTTARNTLDDFESFAKGKLVSSYESLLVDDEAGAGIGLRGQYSDLVVVGQFNPDEPGPATLPDFAEYVVASSGRPVLVVPYASSHGALGKRMLVAWDASPNASRAIAGALPLLRKAAHVDIAVFNADNQGITHGEQPGADIALYLARHRVNVNVLDVRSDIDIGNALLSLAADRNSDMIVMGCYGHSRFRELLAGGVTRTILQTMTVPVLMAH